MWFLWYNRCHSLIDSKNDHEVFYSYMFSLLLLLPSRSGVYFTAFVFGLDHYLIWLLRHQWAWHKHSLEGHCVLSLLCECSMLLFFLHVSMLRLPETTWREGPASPANLMCPSMPAEWAYWANPDEKSYLSHRIITNNQYMYLKVLFDSYVIKGRQ